MAGAVRPCEPQPGTAHCRVRWAGPAEQVRDKEHALRTGRQVRRHRIELRIGQACVFFRQADARRPACQTGQTARQTNDGSAHRRRCTSRHTSAARPTARPGAERCCCSLSIRQRSRQVAKTGKVPATSISCPGSTRPAPKKPATWSPAPATTGVPAHSPQCCAASLLRRPTTSLAAHDARQAIE